MAEHAANREQEAILILSRQEILDAEGIIHCVSNGVSADELLAAAESAGYPWSEERLHKAISTAHAMCNASTPLFEVDTEEYDQEITTPPAAAEETLLTNGLTESFEEQIEASQERVASEEDAILDIDQTLARSLEKDSTGLYLDDIYRKGKKLLSAEQEVELCKRIEAGLAAAAILGGELSHTLDMSDEELEWLATDGEQAKEQWLNADGGSYL